MLGHGLPKTTCFGVTDLDGEVQTCRSSANLADGDYKIEAWHPRSPRRSSKPSTSKTARRTVTSSSMEQNRFRNPIYRILRHFAVTKIIVVRRTV